MGEMRPEPVTKERGARPTPEGVAGVRRALEEAPRPGVDREALARRWLARRLGPGPWRGADVDRELRVLADARRARAALEEAGGACNECGGPRGDRPRFCSGLCARRWHGRDWGRRSRDHLRVGACEQCGSSLPEGSRANRRYCSKACIQQAYRERRGSPP